MKRIIPCFVLVACIFNMLLYVPTTHAQGSKYEWITLPIISDKLTNEAGVAYIPMFRKETETDSLYVELDSACSIIGASWYVENDGFGVNRDCTYLWCDSNLNMKLVISTDFVNRWENPEEVLLEGNLFKCEKIEDIWYVDFIPFCDMFGASFYEVSEQSLGILEENIKNSFGVNNGDDSIDIKSYLDFENYPYYIFVHSGVTLSSIYQKVKEYEDSYIWSYACYENIGLGNENLFQEILYSEQMVSLSFNAANWLSNWINDEYGISKILNSLAVSNYNSSEHYKQALVNVVGVNYGRYLSPIDTSYEDFNQKAEELNSLLNHGTITSSALSSSSELLEKYFNASLPKELNGLDTASKLVNLFGSSYQAYLETCDFHNKLNNVSENKIQLLTKSIIDNQSINNLSEIQRKVTDVLKTVNCTAGTTILLNSIDSYTGLVDSSKEICTLYQNQQQQLNEEIQNALKTGEYVVGDEVIQWALSESGDPTLKTIAAIITVYDSVTAWTQENYGDDLQNGEDIVQYYFIERTMQRNLDFKNPENFYHRLTLMLQASLSCFALEEDYFDSNKNSIANMLYQLDNNVNIEYYRDPREEQLDSEVKDAILSYSDVLVVPIEDEEDIEPVNYTWHLEPTIEAEDIIVSDKDHYSTDISSSICPYDECAIIKNSNKYGIIKYDGSYVAETIYDDFFYDGVYEMTVYTDEDNCCYVFPGEDELDIQFNVIWGRGGSRAYYVIDNTTKKIYSVNDIGLSRNVDNVGYCIAAQTADVTVVNYDSTFNEYSLKIDNLGKYGIIKNSNVVANFIYENACVNFGDNIIALKENGKWGYFDESGNQIIDFVCESFESKVLDGSWWKTDDDGNTQYPFLSSSGYIPVKINGKCGYYDTQGNEVIPCGTFEEVRPVHNGLAWVKKDGLWGVIRIVKEDENSETKSLYYQFIQNELVPEYGLATVDANISLTQSNGIVSALIDDFSNSGSMDLLVVRLEYSAESMNIVYTWYTLEGDSVVVVDEYIVKEAGGVFGIDITLNQGYLCTSITTGGLNSNRVTSTIYVDTFGSNAISPVRTYELQRISGYVDAIKEKVENKLNIEADVENEEFVLDLDDVKAFHDDLSALGLEFNKEEVYLQLINGQDILSFNINVYAYNENAFIISDYTKLRSFLNIPNFESVIEYNSKNAYLVETLSYDIDSDNIPETLYHYFIEYPQAWTAASEMEIWKIENDSEVTQYIGYSESYYNVLQINDEFYFVNVCDYTQTTQARIINVAYPNENAKELYGEELITKAFISIVVDDEDIEYRYRGNLIAEEDYNSLQLEFIGMDNSYYGGEEQITAVKESLN